MHRKRAARKARVASTSPAAPTSHMSHIRASLLGSNWLVQPSVDPQALTLDPALKPWSSSIPEGRIVDTNLESWRCWRSSNIQPEKEEYLSARGKIHLQQELYRSLILRLLGNKGRQKMFESVSKVDKHVNEMNYNLTHGYVKSPTLLVLAPSKVGGELSVFSLQQTW